MKISTSLARRLILRHQGLDGSWQLPAGQEGVAQAIERLGYVQIDTISVVERAHHHVLWARCPGYTPTMLHDLQAKERRIFETWRASAASYVPVHDYPYYRWHMEAFATSPRARRYLEEHATLVAEIMVRIRSEGPLGSSDFAAPEGFVRGTWWSRKPAKEALEMLFALGELLVSERRNFQRRYDLRERVLPADAQMRALDRDEAARFAVRRTLAAQGLASLAEMQRGASRGLALQEALQELVRAGQVFPLEIEGVEGESYYALRETLESAEATSVQSTPHIHILSPFDNLVIDRRRLKKLFGYDYTLECYLPQEKRRYGYFCLPLLWGEHLVARLDAKAERRARTFIVRQITFELGFAAHEALAPALEQELGAFAAFNGCERVAIERSVPDHSLFHIPTSA